MNNKNIFNTGPSDEDDDLDTLVDDELQELHDAIADANSKDEEESKNTPINVENYTVNPFARRPIIQTGTPRTSWTPGVSSIPSFGSSPSRPTFNYNNNQMSSTPYYGLGGIQADRLDRTKKILFLDFYDVIIESFQPGLEPRNLADIKIKFDVLYKISCFTPDYIFLISNQVVETPREEYHYRIMGEFFSAALVEQCNLPDYEFCKAYFAQKKGFSDPYQKPNPGMMYHALQDTIGDDWEKKYPKSSILVIGQKSGFRDQNDRDKRMADTFGCDYLGIEQLLSSY